MKKSTYLIPFLILFVFLQSCEKSDLFDELGSTENISATDLQFQSENFGNPITANFIGTVRNVNFGFQEGVQIQIGNAFTTTDQNGVFVMNDVSVFENFAYIKAEKEGYISGSRVVIPKTNGVNRVEIFLFKQEPVGRVMAGEASEVTISGGGSVQFEGEFITSADGNSYFGPVDVVAHYLRPNSGISFAYMPGSLFGQTASNSARSLETYGMVLVSLYSPIGQPLNIDPNTSATIKLPISFDQTDISPETIPFWSFDEAVGYWKEVGEARKEGNQYVAEVNHFSWWNCDLPIDYVNLCFKLNPTNTISATPYRVFIQRMLNDQYIYSGLVTSGEFECGQIPKDELVKIEVYGNGGSCSSQKVYEQVVGGFSTDASVDLSFDQQFIYTQIKGAVTNCSGNPLNDGYLYLNGSNIASITDGIIDHSFPHCANQSATIQVYDSNTGQWYNEDVILNGAVIELGSFSTCGDAGGIYNGNVTLRSQEDVNSFGLFAYARINGSLTIRKDGNLPSDITDLSPLINLEEVSGGINLFSLSLLENLNGLENLKSTFGLNLRNNTSLTSLSAIVNIETLSSFRLYQNNALTSLDDLDTWSFDLADLSIDRNANLTSIAGLRNVLLTEDVAIKNVSSLTTLEELNFADVLDFVQFNNNPDLVSLAGLENVIEIDNLYVGGNDSLLSLDGLDNLMTTRAFMIGLVFEGDYIAASGNSSLTDYCAVRNFLTNGSYIDPPTAPWFGTRIENNDAFNPSLQMIISGNCSQ